MGKNRTVYVNQSPRPCAAAPRRTERRGRADRTVYPLAGLWEREVAQAGPESLWKASQWRWGWTLIGSH